MSVHMSGLCSNFHWDDGLKTSGKDTVDIQTTLYFLNKTLYFLSSILLTLIGRMTKIA